ncbi:MAG: hypothetical protein QUV05_04645 [Phycisphaerae bacterium]|nr:hypothetical protein [Phycisphaerae bacterium]
MDLGASDRAGDQQPQTLGLGQVVQKAVVSVGSDEEMAEQKAQPLGTTTRRSVLRMEVVQMEQVLKAAGMEKAELAKLMAELIKNDPEVRGAVMQVAYNTPGIMVEY